MKKILTIFLTSVLSFCTIFSLACSPFLKEVKAESISLSMYNVAEDDSCIKRQVIAQVYPVNASNKELSFSVTWAEDSSFYNGSVSVSDYLSLEQKTITSCTLTCYQPFYDNDIILKVSSIDGGATAESRIQYLGTISDLSLDLSNLFLNNTEERGDYYSLKADTLYSIPILASNPFGDYQSNFEIITTYSGSLFVCDAAYSYYETDSDTLEEVLIPACYTNVRLINNLSEISGRFFSELKIENGNLIIQTSEHGLNGYDFYFGNWPDCRNIIISEYVKDTFELSSLAFDNYISQNEALLKYCNINICLLDNITGLKVSFNVWFDVNVDQIDLPSDILI